jgi:hypothetical protein
LKEMAYIRKHGRQAGRLKLSPDPSGWSLPRLAGPAISSPRPFVGRGLLRRAEYLDVRIGVIVGLRGCRGSRVLLLLWCSRRAAAVTVCRCRLVQVLRCCCCRIPLFATLSLPLLRHRTNPSGQLVAIATDRGAVPMFVGIPTNFLRRRTLL